MFTHTIQTLIQQALQSLSIEAPIVSVELPTDSNFGDYTSNVALALAKTNRSNPLDLAHRIAQAMPPHEIIERIDVVKPGFLNFFMKPSAHLRSVYENDVHIVVPDLTGKSFTLEYTDPNPFKEFHIGHLYSNTVGESLARLLEMVGVNVRRVNYQGDVGIHVACSVWGMLQEVHSTKQNTPSEKSHTLKNIEELPLPQRVKWLGQCYAKGATAYKEDVKVKEEIKVLNAQIFMAAQAMWKRERPAFEPQVHYESLIAQQVFPQKLVQEYYEKGRQWTLDYFETIYKRLGTKFVDDGYYFESFIGELGHALVHKHLTDGVFEKSDGAIVFKGEKYGLHTRVFINSFGLPTYEAKEIGLNPTKFADHPFDTSLIITANEIEEYFKVVLKAMSFVAPEVARRTVHIAHGVVKLPEGKMSSRTGKIISGEDLLNDVRDRLLKRMRENGKLAGEELKQTVEKLAVAAIKYSFLRSNVGKDVTFNFEESLSFEGNSGPYLLYTNVRCQSLLSKAHEMGIAITRNTINASILDEALDTPLLRTLTQFPYVAAQAARLYAPHIMCTYLHTLAQAFNAYYDKAPILKAEGELRNLRLTLVEKVHDVLTRGIRSLGFETVEKM